MEKVSISALLIIILSLQCELCFGVQSKNQSTGLDSLLYVAGFAFFCLPSCFVCCCTSCCCYILKSAAKDSHKQVRVIVVPSPNVPANSAPRTRANLAHSRARDSEIVLASRYPGLSHSRAGVKNVPANPEPMAPSYIYYSRAGVKSVPKEKLEVVKSVPANPEPMAPSYIYYSRAGVESVPKEKLEVVKYVPANPAPMAPTYIPHSQAGVESVPKEKLEVVNDVPADPEAKTSANLSHPRGVDTQ